MRREPAVPGGPGTDTDFSHGDPDSALGVAGRPQRARWAQPPCCRGQACCKCNVLAGSTQPARL